MWRQRILIRIFYDSKKKVEFLLPLYNLAIKHLLDIYHGDKQRNKKEEGRKGRGEGSWEEEVEEGEEEREREILGRKWKYYNWKHKNLNVYYGRKWLDKDLV